MKGDRYPRTLHEAFSDADRAQWLYLYRAVSKAEWWCGVVLAAGVGVSLAVLLVQWATG